MGNTVQKIQRNQESPPEEEESKEDETSTFTCEICIEPMLSSSTKKFKNKNRCVHPFCTDCMTKYIQVKVVEESVANVPCPAPNCEQLLDPLSCKAVVPAKLFDKWCDVLCESAVLGLERCYCPNRDCSALVVNECGGNVKKSVCHNCKRPFCFHCKLPWHSGHGCEESREIRNRNDVQFGLLVERKNWKRCPRCHHCIERVTGCRSVICRCGANFCYLCGSEFKNRRCNCNCKCACCLTCFLIVLFIVITVIMFFVQEKCF